MTQLVAKLLVLLAVLLMPLGNDPGAASASHHGNGEHADGSLSRSGARHDMKSGIAECTMVCAAALPAVEFTPDRPIMAIAQPLAAASAHRLHGLHPETDPPPPRQS